MNKQHIEPVVGTEQQYFDDLSVGDALPELRKTPSRVMLFRFSAVTWNAHRIHYDQDYAEFEQHPGVLVQATMHGAFLAQMLTAFAGEQGRLVEMSYSNRGRAIAGDLLICKGTVTALDSAQQYVHCEILECNQHDAVCARGEAIVYLPTRG